MANKILNTKIKQRIDTTANWTTNSSTILENGEFGLERTTTGAIKIKVGDGTSTWAQLDYVSTNSNSGAAADEIYVGTSAPSAGHNYTMWINPEGDELEVSGTYDIEITYQTTNSETLTGNQYENLSYYIPKISSPETGCEIDFDDTWANIIAKYQANQTLRLKFTSTVLGENHNITWFLPCIGFNEQGALGFQISDNSYSYLIVFTQPSQGASLVPFGILQEMASTPEVDNNTIVIDSTTGKLRTGYGDSTTAETTVCTMPSNDSNISIQTNTTDGYMLITLTNASTYFTNPFTEDQPIKISRVDSNNTKTLLINDTINIYKYMGMDNVLVYYTGDSTIAEGLTLFGFGDSPTSAQTTILQTTPQFNWLYAPSEGINMAILSVPLTMSSQDWVSTVVETTATIYNTINKNALTAGNGISIGDNATINCIFGQKTGERQQKIWSIYNSNPASSYINGTTYCFYVNGSYLSSTTSLSQIGQVNREIGNKIRIIKTYLDDNDPDTDIFISNLYSTDGSDYTYKINLKYGTINEYETIECNYIIPGTADYTILTNIDGAGTSTNLFRFLGFYNTDTTLANFAQSFSLNKEENSKEAFIIYLLYNKNMAQWTISIFSDTNDLDLNQDIKEIFQDRTISIYGNLPSLYIGGGCDAQGLFNVALGNNTWVPNGLICTALGGNTIATNSYSTALGDGSCAFGSESLAAGRNALALDSDSIALGARTAALKSNSITIGQDCIARSDNQIVIGYNLIGSTSTPNGTVIVGQCNDMASSSIFQVGAGESYQYGTTNNAGRNAFEVTPNDGCYVNKGGTQYQVWDGSMQLSEMSALDTSTATAAEIATAYNDLIAALKTAGIMQTS